MKVEKILKVKNKSLIHEGRENFKS